MSLEDEIAKAASRLVTIVWEKKASLCAMRCSYRQGINEYGLRRSSNNDKIRLSIYDVEHEIVILENHWLYRAKLMPFKRKTHPYIYALVLYNTEERSEKKFRHLTRPRNRKLLHFVKMLHKWIKLNDVCLLMLNLMVISNCIGLFCLQRNFEHRPNQWDLLFIWKIIVRYVSNFQNEHNFWCTSMQRCVILASMVVKSNLFRTFIKYAQHPDNIENTHTPIHSLISLVLFAITSVIIQGMKTYLRFPCATRETIHITEKWEKRNETKKSRKMWKRMEKQGSP